MVIVKFEIGLEAASKLVDSASAAPEAQRDRDQSAGTTAATNSDWVQLSAYCVSLESHISWMRPL